MASVAKQKSQSASQMASKKSEGGAFHAGNKKNDPTKGQTSIASFFSKAASKEPQQAISSEPIGTPASESLNTSTPQNTSPILKNSSQKVNLERKFADIEAIDDSNDDCVVTSKDEKATIVDECVVVCDSETTVEKKPSAVVKKVQAPAFKAPPRDNKCESKSKKPNSQQNIIRFDTVNQDSSKDKNKPSKVKKPHPEGLQIDADSDVLMVSEFATIFRFDKKFHNVPHYITDHHFIGRKPLGLNKGITVKDLQVWLASRKYSNDSPIAVLHRNMLSSIIRCGETPDEDRLLDEDTWPEVMRQHLQDTYGESKGFENLLNELWTHEYCDLTADARLQALVTIVNDCLQTKIFRDLLDESVDNVDEMRRQQQVDELHDRYKKIDVEVLPQISFAPAANPSAEKAGEKEDAITIQDDNTPHDMEESGGLTERQRAKLKAKQEEEKKRKEEDAKREIEVRKLAEEEAKRKDAERRQERIESRLRSLAEQSAMIRTKSHVCRLEDLDRTYLILSCLDGTRRLLLETRTAGSECAKWSLLNGKENTDMLLSHYSPGAVSDKEKLHHKALQEMVADVDMELGYEQEGAAMQCDAEDENGKEEDEEEAAEEEEYVDVQKRAREMVLTMEECTPDEIFQDYEVYKPRRFAWVEAVCAAQDPQELGAQVQAFERELRRSKMLDGWDEVRAKWLADMAAASTHCVLLYLIKQLRVYVGKQKPKPGKLASIFAGPMRMTRSQARVANKGSVSDKKGRRRLEEEDEVEEDGEDEEGQEEDGPGEKGRCSTRSSEGPCRMTRSQARGGTECNRETRSRRTASGRRGEDGEASEDGAGSEEEAQGSDDSSGPAESDSDFQLDSDDGATQRPARRSGGAGAAAAVARAGTKRPAAGGSAAGSRERRKSQRTARPARRGVRGDDSARRSTRSKGQVQYRFDSDVDGSDSD